MKRIDTNLEGCYILEPDRFGDNRGYYSPFFIEENNKKNNIMLNGVVQGARSLSGKGIVRGLHYQEDPYSQAKLVECLSGGVLDVVVDLRKDSKTYKKWTSVYLTPENGRQLFIPRGFAHGFVSLKDNTLFQYLVDSDYRPDLESGIIWNDPEINIDWQFEKYGIENPILSDKDKVRKSIIDVDPEFYMHKRYMITGATGQLGYEIIKELNSRGIYDIISLNSSTLDITNERLVDKVITEYKPDIIFHCAAYTAVDKAEQFSKDAYNVNVNGTKYISRASSKIGAKLIYISTDYVFDGIKTGAYSVIDTPNPKSVYGETKYLGEKEALKNEKSFICRTSWVFGINGNNFVKTMLNLSEKYDELKVVADQIGSPTYARDLAKLLVDMSQTEAYGIYHTTNSGYCSWYDFASYILKDTNTKVIPVTTEEYYEPIYKKAKLENKEIFIANRPSNSMLDKQCLLDNGFYELSNWKYAVDNYKEELCNEKVKILKK